MRNYASRAAGNVLSILRSPIWLAIETRGRKTFPPLSAEFLSHVSLFFLRVVQEPSCAKYARDYGFIFLGNLPCRFYERPAAANASYKRQVILVDEAEPVPRERVIVIGCVHAFMALLFCFRHFSLPSVIVAHHARLSKRSTSLTVVADYFPAARALPLCRWRQRSFSTCIFVNLIPRACFFIHRSAFRRKLIEN